MTMTTTVTIVKKDYFDHIARQVLGYRELDTFKPGDAGLIYYEVPIEDKIRWQEEFDRKQMEKWEKEQQELKNNGVKELFKEEEPKPISKIVEEKIDILVENISEALEPLVDDQKSLPTKKKDKTKNKKRRTKKYDD